MVICHTKSKEPSQLDYLPISGERERERERDRQRDRETETETERVCVCGSIFSTFISS